MAKLSILIPAYNEEKTIALILEKVKGIKLRGIVKEIIVVDNASTDKTFDILRKYAGKGIRVIRHK
ncbi:MAG: glycosyltransferase, partial [Nanoarchaeota archaeon]